ncbi:MAG: phospholipase [Planctomycetes bacterium]|nr:phospholipase [Planctomycetota bacterium]
MRCTCSLLTVLVALAGVVLGTNVALGEEANLRDQLEKRDYRDAQGESIPYRLFVPRGYDSQKKYPLVLFLHGAGERGSDNEAQLIHPEVLRFVMDEANPSFLVAPQCPAERKWVEVPWKFKGPHKTPEEPSPAMRLTMELLDALEKEFSIDPVRRYLTGLSMGGFGTFDLLVRRPNDFAAAIPICGGADESQAEKIAGVPMWVFHGSKDGAVPVARSRSAVESLKSAGGKPKYTEYEGMGHNVWSRAYHEPELRDWLFRQRRKSE